MVTTEKSKNNENFGNNLFNFGIRCNYNYNGKVHQNFNSQVVQISNWKRFEIFDENKPSRKNVLWNWKSR